MEKKDNFLAAAIAESRADFTQMERRIAAYFLARPDAIIAETNAEIAKKLDLSPMTLTRFFRKLGFNDSADARQKAISSAFGPKTDRVDRRFEDTFLQQQTEDFQKHLELSHASVEAAFKFRADKLWSEIVDLVARSDAVHVTGFQTMYYLADGFCRRLSYLRDRVHIADGIDGVYADLLPADGERAILIMFDMFRYGAHGPSLAKLARERGMEVIILADEFCDWATGITPYVLRYPAETHFFLAMPQGITAGLNLLLQDVSVELGQQAGERVKKLSQAQDYFGLFLD